MWNKRRILQLGIQEAIPQKKKKEEIIQLEAQLEIAKRHYAEDEDKRLKARREESQARERQEAQRVEQQQRIDLELFYKNREAENARKEAKRKAQAEAEVLKKAEVPKKVKKVFVPFESLKKKLSEMTEAEFDSIDVYTIPDDLVDEHERIVDAFIAAKESQSVSEE